MRRLAPRALAASIGALLLVLPGYLLVQLFTTPYPIEITTQNGDSTTCRDGAGCVTQLSPLFLAAITLLALAGALALHAAARAHARSAIAAASLSAIAWVPYALDELLREARAGNEGWQGVLAHDPSVQTFTRNVATAFLALATLLALAAWTLRVKRAA